MPDNLSVSPGSGASVAADDIGGVLWQRVKIGVGVDGSATDVSSSAPLPVGLGAAETHIGEVGAPGDLVTVTPTLDTSAYASGDTLFDATAVANAVRVNGGRAVLQSVVVVDEDDQGAALDLFFFDASVSFGTANAAPSVSDADCRKCLGSVSVGTTDYIDLGGARVACVKGVGLVLKAASGTSLYVAAVTRGTPTYTASGLKIRLGLLWD